MSNSPTSPTCSTTNFNFVIYEFDKLKGTNIIKSKVTYNNSANGPHQQGLVGLNFVTEEGIAVFLNRQFELVLLNVALATNILTTNPYAKLTSISGVVTQGIELSPKYNATGKIDNRYILMLGTDQVLTKRYLIIILFNSPLINLPFANAVTPSGSVIGHTSFRSSM